MGELAEAGVLIIGYGNVLRGDDGVGWLAARELQRYFRDDDDVAVIAAQQLTPEMAEAVSQSRFVLFLDASCGEQPGSIQSKPVLPEDGRLRFTHRVMPATLLATAQQLYGATMPAMSMTLAAWSFELDTELSSGAKARLPEFIRQAKEIVASHRQLSEICPNVCSPAE